MRIPLSAVLVAATAITRCNVAPRGWIGWELSHRVSKAMATMPATHNSARCGEVQPRGAVRECGAMVRQFKLPLMERRTRLPDQLCPTGRALTRSIECGQAGMAQDAGPELDLDKSHSANVRPFCH
mgnify:FL=1